MYYVFTAIIENILLFFFKSYHGLRKYCFEIAIFMFSGNKRSNVSTTIYGLWSPNLMYKSVLMA